jgi:hypothetical protein
MSTLDILLIVIAAAVVIAIVAILVVMARKRAALRRRFGTEYDQLVAQDGNRRQADAELRERMNERRHLDIKPLSPASRQAYEDEWRRVQGAFVDTPRVALTQADALVSRIMCERGYPVDDFEHQAAIVSVDHPDVVRDYRSGHGVYMASTGSSSVSTEDLRQGFVHYRSLFDELVEEPADDRRQAG